MQLQLGTVLDDRYEIEAPLGHGGMAVVYRARHRALGTPCAVKVPTLTSPSVQERLLREGRLQSLPRHPNLVAVTDVVQVRGQSALVMDFVDGPNLAQLLAARRPTPQQLDALAAGILAGMAAAHVAGLVHRDLKPGNILVDVGQGHRVPRIADFGLAVTAAANALDRAGQLTPNYPWLELEWALLARDGGDLEGAASKLDKLVARRPHFLQAWRARAAFDVVLGREEHRQAALDALDRSAYVRVPFFAEHAAWLAAFDRPDEARELLDRAQQDCETYKFGELGVAVAWQRVVHDLWLGDPRLEDDRETLRAALLAPGVGAEERERWGGEPRWPDAATTVPALVAARGARERHAP